MSDFSLYMDKDYNNKLEKFLMLFGLDADYTPEELASSYRALAKLNHPDIARDTASEMRMIIVNEGYGFLKEAHARAVKYEPPGAAAGGRGTDRVFTQYRKGFDMLRGAFDAYFGAPGKSGEGDRELLRERLAGAKDEFSRVINEFPYNEWVDDAIDRINSINRWLG